MENTKSFPHQIRSSVKQPHEWSGGVSDRYQIVATYKHAHDSYLWSVVAIEKKTAPTWGSPYVFWRFNGTDGGMHNGTYDLTKDEAMTMLSDIARRY